MQEEGYSVALDGRVVTIWSAPNFCYRLRNAGAIMSVDVQNAQEFTPFEAVLDEERPLLQKGAVNYFF